MRLIDRYLFQQLLGPTLLATVALTGVAILTSSLSALDILVNDRQSVLIFLEITLLATPQIVAIVLPVAVFVAGLVALNRLQTEQEIVICFAGGMSRWRVASPAVRLAAIISVLALVLNLWVQPLCFRQMRTVLKAVQSDIATSMIRPGEFTHPAPGLTVFAQSMDDDGLIHNLFIDHAGGRGASSTLMASEGRIFRHNGVPFLVLKHGSNQQFSKTGALQVLSFDEYPLDLRPFLSLDPRITYEPSDRYLHELFYPDLTHTWEQRNYRRLIAEGNARLATPLYILAFAALALAAVLGGSFSRLGYQTRIYVAAGAATVVRVLGFAIVAACEGDPRLNVLQYALPLACFLVGMLIVLRQHPARGPLRAPTLFGQPAGTAA